MGFLKFIGYRPAIQKSEISGHEEPTPAHLTELRVSITPSVCDAGNMLHSKFAPARWWPNLSTLHDDDCGILGRVAGPCLAKPAIPKQGRPDADSVRIHTGVGSDRVHWQPDLEMERLRHFLRSPPAWVPWITTTRRPKS